MLRKLINACGFDAYRLMARGFPKRRTMKEFLEYIARSGFSPQTVIDVGVGFGTFELYDTFSTARHLLIEPLKEFDKSLKDISRRYHAEYVVAAAGAQPGTVDINIHSYPERSSLLEIKMAGGTGTEPSREVPVVTIDDLCKEKQMQGPYLIKVDAQGYELRVLDGAEAVLRDTELIILEAILFEFYQNQPQFSDVVSYMKNKGFVVYDIFDGYNRPLDGALALLNVAFVKENGCFRKSHLFS
jgi:FkbM family methyltransferase